MGDKDGLDWKGLDFDVLKRLHGKGFIDNSAKKNKSIVFTEEVLKRSRALFEKLFAK